MIQVLQRVKDQSIKGLCADISYRTRAIPKTKGVVVVYVSADVNLENIITKFWEEHGVNANTQSTVLQEKSPLTTTHSVTIPETKSIGPK